MTYNVFSGTLNIAQSKFSAHASPQVHNPNGTSIGSAIFAQMTAECLCRLQWFACFPLKIAPCHAGI